jgi:hypothetical protein
MYACGVFGDDIPPVRYYLWQFVREFSDFVSGNFSRLSNHCTDHHNNHIYVQASAIHVRFYNKIVAEGRSV